MVDTNIFVDYIRGNKYAINFVNSNYNLAISMLVSMEVFLGFRKQQEIAIFERFLTTSNIKIYSLSKDIAKTAYVIFKTYYHKTNVGIIDSLIAATALVHGKQLVTLNTKHFKNIDELKIVRPY